jgi:hypothetical protein
MNRSRSSRLDPSNPCVITYLMLGTVNCIIERVHVNLATRQISPSLWRKELQYCTCSESCSKITMAPHRGHTDCPSIGMVASKWENVMQPTKRHRKSMTDKREEMYDRWWLRLVVRPCIRFSRLLRPTRYEGVYPVHTRAWK